MAALQIANSQKIVDDILELDSELKERNTQLLASITDVKPTHDQAPSVGQAIA